MPASSLAATTSLSPVRYGAATARSASTLRAALALRARVFRAGRPDADAFDPQARHLVVREEGSGTVVATCRVLILPDGPAANRGYSAQFYDLRGLADVGAPILELGRFCLAPAVRHVPDIPRLLLGEVAALVDAMGARLLMGCSSFPGAEPDRHAPALAWLAAHHLARPAIAPGPAASETTPLQQPVAAVAPSPRGIPPLLRSYLALGGRVSDHAVIDRDLDTLHVLTLVDTATIPPARKARLRALAALAAH
ncbi:GNAT family N-acetyltransferase [Rhodobacteraceae bacterium 2376]|uniref:L-ornithine N(alpha)-acyltransferase n=1 Tax=Rhabdonatronobacter sediminivivens TaxID=2743469 RepID=A0A7Z0HZG9_9RHOB|nr:GNAT family N-acetyltransferase [Rhabdonatronobacter sediminivivens]NYS25153.1 GNAT family N-acetyltransferase [Rhabdonatronobacter sediminivivens]